MRISDWSSDVCSSDLAARDAGFDSIKLNAVLMRGVNDDELAAMVEFVTTRDLSLRFIEVMRTNDNAAFFDRHHVAGQRVIDRLEVAGWQRLSRAAGAGPAMELGHPTARLEARRVGEECVSTRRSRRWQSHTKRHNKCLSIQ